MGVFEGGRGTADAEINDPLGWEPRAVKDSLFYKPAVGQKDIALLRVMMMHHHTKFGCIQFSGSEDIFPIKV